MSPFFLIYFRISDLKCSQTKTFSILPTDSICVLIVLHVGYQTNEI